MIDDLTERLLARRRDDERAYVNDPPQARRVLVRELVLFVVVLAAWMTHEFVDGILAAVCGVVVGFFIGTRVLTRTGRALAYRTGWLDGRAQMIAAMGEASRRGLTLDYWIASEIARDAAVLGVRPQLDDDEDETP